MSTINVVVSKQRTIHVSTNATAGIIDTTVPVTLKNVPTVISGGSTTIDQLLDVDISQRVDGSTLVYNQPTNTYLVKQLDMNEITGAIDDGTF